MRGRKPKPTSRQIAAGDPRKLGAKKLQAKLDNEPKAQQGLTKAPAHLDARAKKAYTFWATELETMKLDCRPDSIMLEGAAVNYSRAVEADMMLSQDGLVLIVPIMNKEGDQVGEKQVTNKYLAISNAAWKQAKSFCVEFGLSPVSRTRLSVDKQDLGNEDLKAILSAPRPERAKPILPAVNWRRPR